MGLVRVVLYAEGPRETSGVPMSGAKDDNGWGSRAPGVVIPDEDQGPGHVLIRRILVEQKKMPEGAIQFEEGLRDSRGRIPKGSQLLRKSTLRRLLSWADPDLAPQLVVVLVDRDGVSGRSELLLGFVEELHRTTNVVAVAKEEFEAWLVADERAAREALKRVSAKTPDPETLEPGEAKATIDQWMSAEPKRDWPMIRRAIAEHCALEILQSRCTVFEQFCSDLGEINL